LIFPLRCDFFFSFFLMSARIGRPFLFPHLLLLRHHLMVACARRFPRANSLSAIVVLRAVATKHTVNITIQYGGLCQVSCLFSFFSGMLLPSCLAPIPCFSSTLTASRSNPSSSPVVTVSPLVEAPIFFLNRFPHGRLRAGHALLCFLGALATNLSRIFFFCLQSLIRVGFCCPS